MLLKNIFSYMSLAIFPILMAPLACMGTDEGADHPASDDAGMTLDRWGFPLDHPLLGSKFLNIAHRGGGLLAPEESMEAYKMAMAAGADMLEMDVRSTSDGVLVLHHDPTVKRITGAAGAISRMTFAEVRALDAGHSFTSDNGATYPYRGKGIVVATFREVLEAFPTAIFSAEIKQSDPPIVDDVLRILAETGMEDRVILVSFDDFVVKEVRRKNPRIVTGASMDEMVSFGTLAPENFAGYKPPCPVWQLSGIEPDFLDFARSLGMKVQIWTINDPGDMRAWMDMGVNGVMTDDPALLESVIHGKNAK